MQGRRGRKRASLKLNKADGGRVFKHPGKSLLVLSKQQLRNQRSGDNTRPPGLPGTEKQVHPLCFCWTLFEVCCGARRSENGG